jgi:hypothetical protein
MRNRPLPTAQVCAMCYCCSANFAVPVVLCGADVCSPSGAICGTSGTCPLASAGEYYYSGGKHLSRDCALCVFVCVCVTQGSLVLLLLFCLNRCCRQTYPAGSLTQNLCFYLQWHCQCHVHLNILQCMISLINLHCACPGAPKPCH